MNGWFIYRWVWGHLQSSQNNVNNVRHVLGAIQVLRNAVGRGMSDFLEKSIAKVYDSMLLVFRGCVWVGVKFPGKSRTVLVNPSLMRCCVS